MTSIIRMQIGTGTEVMSKNYNVIDYTLMHSNQYIIPFFAIRNLQTLFFSLLKCTAKKRDFLDQKITRCEIEYLTHLLSL